jgi:hypothetical protein
MWGCAEIADTIDLVVEEMAAVQTGTIFQNRGAGNDFLINCFFLQLL